MSSARVQISDAVPEEFRSITEKALLEWAPNSALFVLKDLVGGKSTASVLLVDIAPLEEAVAPFELYGQFILKLDNKRIWDSPEPNEKERHELAESKNPTFAKQHIPNLLRHKEDDKQIALLYEIAGLQGLINLVTADSVSAGELQLRCRQLSLALLNEFNRGHKSQANVSASESLAEWLGYRLDNQKAPHLHEFISHETNNQSAFVIGGRVLVNPLSFCNLDVICSDKSHVRLLGLLHGDLHPGNLLLQRKDPTNKRFWLIDFALSHLGPLGYDHAYFEFALLLQHLGGKSVERLFNLLEALDTPQKHKAILMFPTDDLGLFESLYAFRSAINEWQQKKEKNRVDPVIAQFLLARVAVSLNWINKPLQPTERQFALGYGSWAAWKYLETFHNFKWHELKSEADTHRSNLNTETTQETKTEDADKKVLWNQLWEATDGFNSSKSKFVLITGKQSGNPDLPSLGFIPWSVVIDFDPASDTEGLYAAVVPLMKKLRSVIYFGKESLPVDYERGTAWLMAGGWPSRNEPVPDSIREWRRDYLSRIRDLSLSLQRAITPVPVKVLVFPGAGLTGSILERTLEVLDEIFRDSCQVILLGSDVITDESLTHIHIPLSPSEFAASARNIYGTQEEVDEPQIPGADGPVPISLERLRNLEEDLEILHSRILFDAATQETDPDTFWRGAPPSWADLHSNNDIERDILEDLITALDEQLLQSRNHTVELLHSPGAGGTTAALRAAWELRNIHPTAILRRTSKLTVDRIDQLFKLAQRPVLLIVDAFSRSVRDEIYSGLADRNARVVMLYVSRTINAPDDKPLILLDPMKDKEAEKFYEAFSKRTTKPERRRLLGLISRSPNPYWTHYRSPFFFGLITFDREFTSIERYVKAYLADTTYRVQKALRYLAMVTRYTQVGVHESLFKLFLGLQRETKSSIEEAIGTGPNRLLVQQGSYVKLLHPLIAEEVLRQLLGGSAGDGWKDGLKVIAIDFIHEVNRLLGNKADETLRLFEKLFARRDDWFAVQGRRHFSEFIEDIPTKEGQHEILELLTEICPDEAHFWNHLGRHEIYRMKQDYASAETYLEKAVELSPNDRLHHHSLGMVRRFWLDNRLSQLFKEQQDPTLRDVLELINELFSKAAACFQRTRELAPEDDHGYITHIQLILETTEYLYKAVGVKHLGADAIQNGELGTWLRKNIVKAEQLLFEVQKIRADGKPSRFELDCIRDLTTLYGTFGDLIKTWEAALNSGKGNSDLRRALATTYYTRKGRVWSSMPESELRRIVVLMEDNFRDDPTQEQDIRMWFQAYRRLPEFTYLQALDRLQAWASRAESVDAYYYLYILSYLLWHTRSSRSNARQAEEQTRSYLDKCRKLAKGRRGHSYEWFALSPEWCPLAHYSELGTYDTASGFYPKTDSLAFVNGTIETIRGPQSGTIRVGDVLRAFFVPSINFWESQNINDLVHFYLGFSYDGLRAWSVGPGPAPTSHGQARARRSTIGISTIGSAKGSVSITEQEDKSPHKPSASISGRSKLLRDRVKHFIFDAIAVAENQGQDLLLTTLGKRLNEHFRKNAIFKQLGFKTLTDLVLSYSGLTVTGKGPKKVVHRIERSATRVATAVTHSDNSLKQQVKLFIFDKIRELEGQGKPVWSTTLGAFLKNEYPGEPVFKRLGYPQLLEFMRSIDEIECIEERDNYIIRISVGEPAGRQPQPTNKVKNQYGGKSNTRESQSLRSTVEAFVLKKVAEAEHLGKPIQIKKLGTLLNREFPGEPIYSRLGFNTLMGFLRATGLTINNFKVSTS